MICSLQITKDTFVILAGHDWTKIPICSVFLFFFLMYSASMMRCKSPCSPEGEQHCAGTAHSPAVPANRLKIEYLSFQCQTEIFRRGKRESGANPERSGHCERGDGCKTSLCISHEKAQPRSMIRESGNLLKYSVHSFRRKRFALLSHKWLGFEYVKRRLLFRKKRQASFLLACK